MFKKKHYEHTTFSNKQKAAFADSSLEFESLKKLDTKIHSFQRKKFPPLRLPILEKAKPKKRRTSSLDEKSKEKEYTIPKPKIYNINFKTLTKEPKPGPGHYYHLENLVSKGATFSQSPRFENDSRLQLTPLKKQTGGSNDLIQKNTFLGKFSPENKAAENLAKSIRNNFRSEVQKVTKMFIDSQTQEQKQRKLQLKLEKIEQKLQHKDHKNILKSFAGFMAFLTGIGTLSSRFDQRKTAEKVKLSNQTLLLQVAISVGKLRVKLFHLREKKRLQALEESELSDTN